jgi:glycosyltransferase involved in cell wall biosynthesis
VTTLLSVNNYHYRRGGADAVYLDHDALFRADGWTTACFAMRHPKNIESPHARYFVDEIEFGHEYGMRARLSMAAKIIYSTEARDKVASLVDEVQPDIAHVHCVYHHISPSVLPVLNKRGIPVVLTAHDLKLLCPAYTMLSNGENCERCSRGAVWNAALRRCIKGSLPLSGLIALESGIHRLTGIYRHNVDRIVAPSRFYRDKFVQYGWPAAQLAYIPNFVRVEDFTPRYDSDDYFVYIGRLSYEKGIATLVEAAVRAGAELVVVGDGSMRESLSRDAAARGASIRFTGYQSGESLRALLRNARALVLPSEWYENAPISVLEAYASGKPVIGARIGGIPELIAEGETGWLFESGSVDGLEALLARVRSLSRDSLVAAGRAARQRAETRHTPDHYLAAMKALYAELGVPAGAGLSRSLHG